jgi:hypothetical protein
VHDSFWTHAGTVERMNELLREKFIELHSQVGGACRNVCTGERVDVLGNALGWWCMCSSAGHGTAAKQVSARAWAG